MSSYFLEERTTIKYKGEDGHSPDPIPQTKLDKILLRALSGPTGEGLLRQWRLLRDRLGSFFLTVTPTPTPFPTFVLISTCVESTP